MKESEFKKMLKNILVVSMDFETNRVEQAKNLTRIAWSLCGLLAFLLVVIVVSTGIERAKRVHPAPVVIWGDKATGDVTVGRPLLGGKETYDQITNRAWLRRFINHCLAYDWVMISVENAACGLMASPKVMEYLTPYIEGENSPLKRLAENGRAKIEFDGVTFLQDGVAQARFTRVYTDHLGQILTAYPLEKYIATLRFKYQPDRVFQNSEQEQMNPLRLWVYGITIDDEVVRK